MVLRVTSCNASLFLGLHELNCLVIFETCILSFGWDITKGFVENVWSFLMLITENVLCIFYSLTAFSIHVHVLQLFQTENWKRTKPLSLVDKKGSRSPDEPTSGHVLTTVSICYHDEQLCYILSFGWDNTKGFVENVWAFLEGNYRKCALYFIFLSAYSMHVHALQLFQTESWKRTKPLSLVDKKVFDPLTSQLADTFLQQSLFVTMTNNYIIFKHYSIYLVIHGLSPLLPSFLSRSLHHGLSWARGSVLPCCRSCVYPRSLVLTQEHGLSSLNGGKCNPEPEYGCQQWPKAYLRLRIVCSRVTGTWADVMGATHTVGPLLLGES